MQIKSADAIALLVLILAAVLEAGGDAMMRSGINEPRPLVRAGLFVGGGIILALYGYTVNVPRWDFGRLLGLYVVFFFIVAQVISWVAFHQAPDRSIWIGGLLIVLGGVVLWLGKAQ